MCKSLLIHLNRHALLYLVVFMALAFIFIAHPTFANTAEPKDLPFVEPLVKLKEAVRGPVAMALSIIGIVVAGGVLIFGGELNAFFRSMIFLVLVIAIIVGGSNLIEGGFFGQAAEITGISTTQPSGQKSP